MSKLIFGCVMLSSASLLAPTQVVSYFGPTAQTVIGTVRSALDISTVMPALRRIGR